jgi:anaerobic selenocysteine-containing dehydrogenase
MAQLRTIRTVCPRNCYCTCGMLVSLDEIDRVVGLEGDPLNTATAGRICLKGQSYARRITSPDRLLTPQRRRPGGLGFEPVSWDVALADIAGRLDDIAGRLADISTTSGRESVLC